MSRYDWLVIFYDISANYWHIYHNDTESVRSFMSQEDIILCGFNNKGYDNFIVKAICCGADNELIKQINDFIIKEDRNGWEHYFIRQNKFWFDSFDLMDDTQVGTSLKHTEAHRGVDIAETEVDFELQRPWTQEELKLMVKYCRWDVWNTAQLLTLRRDYLECKIELGRMCGLPDAKALYMTNARLTAKYLGATRVERYDGRDYVFPENLNTAIIPQPILDFFLQIRDKSIPDRSLFERKLNIDIGGCPCTYAWGGVHGSLTQYHERSTDTRVIQNRDVSSLYPSLLIKYNYISRNCEDPHKFEDTYNKRIAAKHSGDKKTAKTLKNPLNVTSGAMDQPTNDLYDPRNARSMRISGQLFLTELVIELLTQCSTLRLLNFNTDGLMYSVDTVELPLVDSICAAWEQRTRFELETDNIKSCYIKDVNNLLFVDDHDKIKTVGGYLNYGIAEKGAWKINNDFTIVKDAVIAWFAHGTPVEETVLRCTDILKFQIIAKAGRSYDTVYQVSADYEQYRKDYERNNPVIDPETKRKRKPNWSWSCYSGPRNQVQRVNRVYAANYEYVYTHECNGTLVKIKPDGSVGKIGGLPDCCVIDNRNELSILDIDRNWYVDLAKKYIQDYTGEVYPNVH